MHKHNVNPIITAVSTTLPTIAPTIRACGYGDVNCVVEESTKYISSGVLFIINAAYYIMALTLIWMLIYAATGQIPGYKRKGGSGGILDRRILRR
jgi:hypothetical protein